MLLAPRDLLLPSPVHSLLLLPPVVLLPSLQILLLVAPRDLLLPPPVHRLPKSVVGHHNAERKIQKSTNENAKEAAPPALNPTAKSVDEPVNAERKFLEKSESVDEPINAERNIPEKCDQKEMERLFNRLQSSLKKAGGKLPVSKKKKLFHRGVSEEALDII